MEGSITARKTTMPERYLLKSKICLVGERGVGKSSLIRRYVLDQFDDKYVRTLGAKVEKKTMRIDIPEGQAQVEISMAIWDIIGHVGFRQLLGDSFFNGAHGCRRRHKPRAGRRGDGPLPGGRAPPPAQDDPHLVHLIHLPFCSPKGRLPLARLTIRSPDILTSQRFGIYEAAQSRQISGRPNT